MLGQLTTSRSALAPWTRRGPFAELRDEMDNMLERFWGEEANGCGIHAPALDLSETDSAVQVRLDLPGVEAKEIDVQVRDNRLVVTGEHKEEKEEKGEKFHRIERREGKFSRSVMLPCAVNEGKVDARFHNGVLTITLPKADQAKAKRVEVKTA
jgi:HSP20 family protein